MKFIILSLLFVPLIFFASRRSYASESTVSQVYAKEVQAVSPVDVLNAWSSLNTVYDLYCTFGDCGTNRQFWVGTLAQDVFELGMMNSCADTVTNIMKIKGGECINTSNLPSERVFLSDPESRLMLENGRLPGGAATILAGTYSTLVNEPPIPTNLALFIRDSTKDTIFGTPAYAAVPDPAQGLEVYVLTAWKVVRNISLSLFGLMVGIVALMVMFRHKISPQATVTIYNALPMIPVVLLLIVLSYPIAALAIARIPDLMYLAAQLGQSMMPASLGNVPTDTVDFIWWVIASGINSSLIVLGEIANQALVYLFFLLGIFFIGIFSLFFGIINFIKAYASLIITIIVSPIILMMSILPNNRGLIMNLAKRISVDILTLPTMLLGFIIGISIIIFSPKPPDAVNMFFYFNVFFIRCIAFLIGFAIMWKAARIRGVLEGLFKVQNIWGVEDPKKSPRR